MKTVMIAVRVPAEIKRQADEALEKTGATLTHVVTAALIAYASQAGVKGAKTEYRQRRERHQ
jgi:antitoxin component of RelBE/YafQ-DinJ toxin-antitoxin module